MRNDTGVPAARSTWTILKTKANVLESFFERAFSSGLRYPHATREGLFVAR
jgi:hypothetical protein